MVETISRGEVLLNFIHDEVEQRLNPSGEDCPECGGDGYISSCFEEFACIDPESGCEDCTRRCRECAQHKYNGLKAVREEVIKANDIDLAVAWLKDIGRWRDGITEDQVRAELAKEAAKLTAPSPIEIAGSEKP